MLDLSGLTPEARPIVEAAAAIYIRHTRPWFVGLIAHGSAFKGGFIPGCSDIDLQLYLDQAAFSEGGQLPIALSLAIHRDLSLIDPAPFQYIQCYALTTRLPDGYVGPIPGAYHLVAGRLPVVEATAEQLHSSARTALAKLSAPPPYIARTLLEHGGGKLERSVRLLCTDVWPILYQVLALRQDDPIRVWGMPKDRAIESLPVGSALGQAIRAFYAALRAYYPAQESIEEALATIVSGVAFLEAARQWWEEVESDHNTAEK